MIHKDWFEVFATRHGIATEPNAKNELITVLKEKGHKIIKLLARENMAHLFLKSTHSCLLFLIS